MINWLKGLLREKPQYLSGVPEINLSEWMSSGQADELSRKLADPTIVMALRIVSESIPVCVPSQSSREHEIIFGAGITAGYSLCLENLRKLASSGSSSEIEAKFENIN
jgi:hypothetical protein